MNKLLLVKIGGSLTTNKEKNRTANPAFIKKFARDFAAVYREHPDWDIVLGTGVGSFAHFSAHKYGLREGAKTQEQFYGVAVAHSEAQYICALITQALIDAGVPAFSLTPSSMITTDRRKVRSKHLETLKLLFANRYLPVIHGDTLLDSKLGVIIGSTEISLQVILEELHALYGETCAVYITKTDGVLNERGETIKSLDINTLVPIINSLEHDTTGSMGGKVQAARKAAQLADRVYIIGPDMGKLGQILAGQDADTRVLPG